MTIVEAHVGDVDVIVRLDFSKRACRRSVLDGWLDRATEYYIFPAMTNMTSLSRLFMQEGVFIRLCQAPVRRLVAPGVWKHVQHIVLRFGRVHLLRGPECLLLLPVGLPLALYLCERVCLAHVLRGLARLGCYLCSFSACYRAHTA